MKNPREEYIIDSFVDFTGTERKFIIAAVSQDCLDCTQISEEEIEKALYLGISVCNAKDTFDEELGKRIAKGKALSPKSRIGVLHATKRGVINTKMVRALLEQEAEYMKQNPGTYLRGYDKDKEMYLYAKSMEDTYNSMDERSRQTVNLLKSKTPEEMWEIFKTSAYLKKVDE